MPDNPLLERIKSQVHDCLERHEVANRPAVMVRTFLIALIALNILAFVLQTVPAVNTRYEAWFQRLMHFSMAVFTLEFALRVWVAPLHPEGLYTAPVRGRLRFVMSPVMLADLLVIVAYFFAPATLRDLRFVRIIRLLWMLKITRFLPAVATLGRVLRRERRTLLAVVLIMLTMLFVASSLVYLLEHQRQPDRFATIAHAMWWGVATLTTVGYGDVVPVSPMGKILGVIIMLLGVGTFALPAGILASAFSEERKRRDFMVTWNLVAQVPLFSSLNAREIADITTLLRPMDVMVNEVIFHKGDEADSMYFIVSGELEVELQQEPRRLGASEYFGELGLLYHQPRTATVIAVTRAELLELDAKDLHYLFERKPELRALIMQEAERRLANDRLNAAE